MIKTAILDLYKQTLPEIIRDEHVVREIINRPGNHIIHHVEQEAVVGVSVIGGNVIYLLCVADAFQGQGIGSALLAQSEAYIAAQGYTDMQPDVPAHSPRPTQPSRMGR